MDNPFQSPSVLSLCPGFLGLERGLQRAIGKIRVAAYVEIESFIIANLIAGMEAGVLVPAPVWSNVKTFSKVAKHFCGKVDGIMGGYPCQPFSLAGKRKGHQDPRHLWPSICGIIKTTGPVWCFFENVSGHLSIGYDQVYKDLRALGYTVEAGIFTAEEAGAPHERERLFILAISERFLSYSRGERVGWQTWTNINWSGQRAKLADTSSQSGQQITTRGLDMERDTLSESGRDKGANGLESFNKTMGNTESGNARSCAREDGQIESGRSGKEELGDTNGRRCQQCNPQIRIQCITGAGCESMANSNQCGGIKNSQLSKFWTIGVKQPPEHSRIAIAGQNDKERKGEMEYTDNTRCREFSGTESISPQFTSIECTSAFNGIGKDQSFGWPAGPGSQQYDWEEPRTVKSRMGSYVNGYNFREDLLRAYGNSVVEQCAEIAFLHLLKKHMRNIGQ